jgi:sec-independent protein translocase protein TatB
MGSIGGGEVLIVALVALVVLGPTRLPQAARQVGKAIGEIRQMTAGFQAELRDTLNAADPPRPPVPKPFDTTDESGSRTNQA